MREMSRKLENRTFQQTRLQSSSRLTSSSKQDLRSEDHLLEHLGEFMPTIREENTIKLTFHSGRVRSQVGVLYGRNLASKVGARVGAWLLRKAANSAVLYSRYTKIYI